MLKLEIVHEQTSTAVRVNNQTNDYCMLLHQNNSNLAALAEFSRESFEELFCNLRLVVLLEDGEQLGSVATERLRRGHASVACEL